MNIDLKHCPFCGGTADIRLGVFPVSLSTNTLSVCIECRSCLAKMSEIIHAYASYNSLDGIAKELAKKWNRRCEQ